jgi:hypothetical protein
MKRRKNKAPDLMERFQSTCGWCGQKILPGKEVFGGGGKARPGIDLSAQNGQVLPLYLVGSGKTVLVAVPSPDSDARREGHDFVYMTCSRACAEQLRAAFQGAVESGKRWGLP